MSEKTFKFKDHSVLLLICLDSVSVTTLVEPGMWQSLSHMSHSIHHSQIFKLGRFVARNPPPPPTTFVVNIRHHDFIVRLNPYVFAMNEGKPQNTNRAAFSSK